MKYEIEKIAKEEQQTSLWAGGTTTQLAIYPKEALYSERNFLWRLSSARVEVDESIFTSLPGIWRHIMIIEGELKLIHEGHHKIVLNPYEKDSFDGAWTTRSFGKVTDFNLMLAEGCNGELRALHIDGGNYAEVHLSSHIGDSKTTEAFYCTCHPIKIQLSQNETIRLNQGDLLLVHSQPGEEHRIIYLQNSGVERASVIQARIVYK
ncbi:environmental stress-induced protein Ves [Anaerosolibacter carboniphilus]|uniref:Environmental stress-induced protein Ves n=1 Tax=Anaerosolibacter carboniphilus TaxID=1417629 RepID=A0A841L5C6_9FIRM|nr:HutD family protein [Anaerosolibacter carboniphilus]MBB6218312.1 environmental stress-induced protein Ves [Anaerosolibacter carboniphilus]